MKLSIAVAVALVLAGGALATGAEQNTNYVTGWVAGTPTLTIWCGSGGHNYAPIGNPEDYGSTDVDPTGDDPVADAEGAEAAYESWAASGEPECAPTDTAFGTGDDSGLGGAAFCVAGTERGVACGDHLGHAFLGTTNDIAGTPWFSLTAETCGVDQDPATCTTSNNTGANVVGSGCGTASITIPTNMARHWQSSAANPLNLVWARIAAVFVDEDTAAVCLGASGTITASF